MYGYSSSVAVISVIRSRPQPAVNALTIGTPQIIMIGAGFSTWKFLIEMNKLPNLRYLQKFEISAEILRLFLEVYFGFFFNFNFSIPLMKRIIMGNYNWIWKFFGNYTRIKPTIFQKTKIFSTRWYKKRVMKFCNWFVKISQMN